MGDSADAPRGQLRQDPRQLGSLYDAEYFEHHCGVPYTRDDPGWSKFFAGIAEAIARELRPASVIDAGCAIGFLVEELRARGVEAFGFDLSEWAIAQVPDELQPYVWVASVTDELERSYGLAVCIEVLEHLPEPDAEVAVANLCGHAETILFSSTPSDRDEPTHLNVQPAAYWAELFARCDFYRDESFDASVVAEHATFFRRGAGPELAAVHECVREELAAAQARRADLEEELAATEARRDDLHEQLGVARREASAASLELAAAERFLAAAQTELTTVSGRLGVAEARLLEWESWRERGGWRIYQALFELRARLAPPASRRDRAVRTVLGHAAFLLERRARRAPVANGPHGRRTCAVLILSGCPGDAFRYRGEHQAEQLVAAGATADAALVGTVDLGSALDRYAMFILHRVAWDEATEGFVRAAARSGKRVLFDTDDLVFDPTASRYVAALDSMGETERALYLDGLGRYRRTLRGVSGVTVSTLPLADAAREVNPRVEVSPNTVSEEMLRIANRAASRRAVSSGRVTLAYLSGTPTHDRDFLEAADAVLWALQKYEHAHFLAVGHLQLDERFDQFGDRVERLPLQPWQSLPTLLARVDINLAPLEPNNPFTEAKSCLKYLEAALVGVATIASPRSDFVRVINPGENGILAEGRDEWQAAVDRLIESPEERSRIGRRAFQDVRDHHTTRARSRALHRTIADLVEARNDEPLRINWVLRAPIARRAGGYRTIFRLADALGRRGHDVRIHVERIAHLQGMSTRDIETFVEDAFGPLHAKVVVGHELQPADVSIATNWPTAPLVAAHDTSLFKAYFIQDYEPEFYERSDPLYDQAEQTYLLPLRHLCYGGHLARRIEETSGRPADHVDFALEPPFRMTTPPRDRLGPPTVLFFARPDQARRGFDLGVAALERLHRAVPEAEVLLFGSTDAELPDLPFPARNLGVLSEERLASALNAVHIFLSFSLTNISHAPYEAMACGCAVVEADLPQIRSMVEPGSCVLAKPTVEAVSADLELLIRDADTRIAVAERGIEATAGLSWDSTATRFEKLLRSLAFVRLGSDAI